MAVFRRLPLESNQGCAMKINWIIADNVKLDAQTIEKLKLIGPLWGGWPSWHNCSTDNVICHELPMAQEFVERQQQKKCNFYVPNSFFQDLDRPAGVKLYAGEFGLETDYKNEIICMHLVSSRSDIVLLKGMNLTAPQTFETSLQKHRWHNYKNLVKQVIVDHPSTQWVLVDHSTDIDKEFKKLTNLTVDSLSNVIKLLLPQE